MKVQMKKRILILMIFCLSFIAFYKNIKQNEVHEESNKQEVVLLNQKLESTEAKETEETRENVIDSTEETEETEEKDTLAETEPSPLKHKK